MTTQAERTANLINNLPRFLQNDSDSNTYKFLNSFSPQFNIIENDLTLLQNSLYIDAAKGNDLDKLAALFKVTRTTNETDASFRGRVKGFFQTAIKSGSTIGLKESLANSLNIETSDITVTTVQNNIFDLSIAVTLSSDLGVFVGIRSLVNSGKAAGMYFRTFDLTSANGIFLTEVSYIDGADLIL